MKCNFINLQSISAVNIATAFKEKKNAWKCGEEEEVEVVVEREKMRWIATRNTKIYVFKEWIIAIITPQRVNINCTLLFLHAALVVQIDSFELFAIVMKNRISVHEIFQRHSNVTIKIAIVSFYFVFNKWNFICKARSQHLQLQAMVINLTSNEKTINSYLPATFQHITTCFTILFVRRASKTLPSTSLALFRVCSRSMSSHMKCLRGEKNALLSEIERNKFS